MTTRAYSYGAKAPTENAELVRQQLILAHRYANRLVEIERERREASLKANEDEQALEASEATAARASVACSGSAWAPPGEIRSGLRSRWSTTAISLPRGPSSGPGSAVIAWAPIRSGPRRSCSMDCPR